MGTSHRPVPPEALLEHAGWVRALARALCRDEHAAADLEQETWLAALRGGAHARDARAWLGSVARRLAAGRGRSEGRRSAREADVAGSRPPDAPDPAETLASVELSARLARAVAELEEPYRTTLALRYYEGLPPRRIAQRLGVDVRAVESRLRRGREKLREALDRQCGGRDVWFGAALALAFAGGEGAGRGLSLAALLALLLGGGAAGVAVHRSRAAVDPAPRASAESRALENSPDGLQPPLVADSPDARSAVEARGTRVPMAVTEFGAEFVIEGSGAPLADAPVTWGDSTGRREVRSDADGRVLFDANARDDEIWLGVEALDRTQSLNARVARRDFTRLEVPRRGGEFQGVVVDVDRRPVAGAEVLAWRNQTRWVDPDRPDRRVRTDHRGRFVVDDVAGPTGHRASWSLSASDVGRATYGRLAGDYDPVHGPGELTLVLEPAWDVRGRVSAGRGIGVEGVPLVVFPRRPDLGGERAVPENSAWRPAIGSPEFAVVSGENGEFAFQVVAPAVGAESLWRIQANSSRHRRTLVDLRGPGWVDVHLDPGARLAGQVVDARGLPIAGARVDLRSHERRDPLTTDVQGRFAYDGLSDLEGAMLAVTAPGHAIAVRVLDLPPREDLLVVALEAECRLRGVALDEEGEPLRARLYFEGDRRVDSPWLARSMTWEEMGVANRHFLDNAGRFDVRGLYPGRYWLQLIAPGSHEVLACAVVDLVPGEGAPPLELRAGQGLELALTVRGQVIDSTTGQPARSFTVDARRYLPEGEHSVRFDTWESDDGRFEMRGLIPGLWTFGAFSRESGEHRGTETPQPESYGPGVVDLGELRFVESSRR